MRHYIGCATCAGPDDVAKNDWLMCFWPSSCCKLGKEVWTDIGIGPCRQSLCAIRAQGCVWHVRFFRKCHRCEQTYTLVKLKKSAQQPKWCFFAMVVILWACTWYWCCFWYNWHSRDLSSLCRKLNKASSYYSGSEQRLQEEWHKGCSRVYCHWKSSSWLGVCASCHFFYHESDVIIPACLMQN